MASLLTCASKAASVMTTRSFFLAHCLFAELSSVLLSVGGEKVLSSPPALAALTLATQLRHASHELRDRMARLPLLTRPAHGSMLCGILAGRRVMQYLDPAFCKKYRLTMGLLRELELRCRTRHEVAVAPA